MPSAHKGAISFGLVHIPIQLQVAVREHDLSFNQLCKKTGERIRYKKYCPSCNKEIKQEEIVKGYEYEKDKYVIITAEDLEKIQTEKDKTIQILKFVKEAEVDPVYFEKNYYAQPDKQGQKAFDLLREAMLATKKAAVARTVLGTKEALLLIRATEDGMRVTSLYFEDEIVTAPAKTASKLTKAEVTMAKQLIDQLSGPFDIADYQDEYQERLRSLIERKIHGQEIVKVKEKQSVQAVDLMEVLSQSLKQNTAGAAKAKTARKRTGKSLS